MLTLGHMHCLTFSRQYVSPGPEVRPPVDVSEELALGSHSPQTLDLNLQARLLPLNEGLIASRANDLVSCLRCD